MMSHKKLIGSILVLSIALVGAYWYWSPYIAIHQIRAAAQSNDPDALSDHVDFPRLRESFKSEFSAKVTAAMSKDADTSSDTGKGFAALGAMFASAMIDKMVDSMLQPQAVINMVRNAKMQIPAAARADAAKAAVTDSANTSDPKWDFERKSMDRLVAYAPGPGPHDTRFAIVFERSGFANWKLVGVHFPADK